MKAVTALCLFVGCSVAAAQQERFSKLVRHFCRSLAEGDVSANETLTILAEEVQSEVEALCIALSASCRERYDCYEESKEWNGTEGASVCDALNMTRTWVSSITLQRGSEQRPPPGGQGTARGACSQVAQVAEDWDKRHSSEVEVGPEQDCEELAPSTDNGGEGMVPSTDNGGEGDGGRGTQGAPGTGGQPSGGGGQPRPSGGGRSSSPGPAPAPPGNGNVDDERLSRFPGEELLSQCGGAASLLQTEEQPERDLTDGDMLLYLAIGLALVLAAACGCILACVIQRRRKAKAEAKAKAVEEDIKSSNKLPAYAAGKV